MFETVEVRDFIEETLDETPQEASIPVVDAFARTSLIEINAITPAGFEPLIDEPVTGTGNDDLLGGISDDDDEDDPGGTPPDSE
ncbi:hypothetical protein NOLU111490_15020 [Novosphingobium lubricantis]